MNKESVLAFLRSTLGAICCAPGLIDEMLELIAESGAEERVYALLTTRLAQLMSLGVLATNLKEFEPIGNGLFSMHLTGRGFNLRILYGFLPNRQPVLLLPFHERGGKSKTDYSSYLEPAKRRLETIKGEYEDGKFR